MHILEIIRCGVRGSVSTLPSREFNPRSRNSFYNPVGENFYNDNVFFGKSSLGYHIQLIGIKETILKWQRDPLPNRH